MLVCNVSLLRRRAAIAADLAEAAAALDAPGTGNVVFATLVDDPASVGEHVDAFLGQIMREAASASSTVNAGFAYAAAIVEAASAADLLSSFVPIAVVEAATANSAQDATVVSGIVSVLLVHFDGANGSTTFTDVSASAHPLSASNVNVNTSSPKFGTGSGDFSSAGSSRINVSATGSTDFQFGAGQFTIETWAYFTSAPGGGVSIIIGNFTGSSNLGFDFGMVAGALAFYYSTTGSDNPNVGAAYTPALNTWIHLAVDRDAANVLRVYANGVVVASATVASTLFPSTIEPIIGNDGNASRNFLGRLDELRVTKGTARYGGAFTPPSSPFSS